MTQNSLGFEQYLSAWSSFSSHFIGDCFDLATPYVDREYAGIDPYVKFVSGQLYLDCHLTSESVLILIRESKEWDADLLCRSVMEGSFKYIYMLSGVTEEVRSKAEEYWFILPKFSDIKHSERAARLLQELPNPAAIEWQPLRDLVVNNEEIDSIRKDYTRPQRQALEEKWSFSGISKQFMQSTDEGLRLFGMMAHGYGMSSHFIHKDADGVGMVWERAMRPASRKEAVMLGHAARVVSDICTFSKLRLLYLLKYCGGDVRSIHKLEKNHALLFEQLEMANAQFNRTEYESSNKQ
jgi:hypothetical protein